jgi:LysM repeat protein
MDQRTRKSPARFLAPLALIAVLVAFLAIVTSSGDSGGAGSSEPANSTSARTTTTTKASTKAKAKAKAKAKKEDAGDTYTVQVGDTLGGIADKTGVPLERIEELNPNVDPHAMNSGQEIRLK